MPDELPSASAAPAAPAPAPRPAGPGEARTAAVSNPWPFVGLVITLCVAGWLLVNWMSETTRIQDCVMSGRKNCAPLDPKLGR